MIRTDKQLYKYFLTLINKERTHTIVPEMFNLVINVALINWVKEKLPLNEFKQVRIEDLNLLLVDGSLGKSIIPEMENVFPIPLTSIYNVRPVFKIKYKDNPCHEDNSIVTKTAILMKYDKASAIEDSYYLKPTDDRLYYRYTNEKIHLITGKYSGESNTIGIAMLLDYYRYPTEIEFNPVEMEKTLEFKPSQLQEVAEKAAQEFLEKNTDPRYQSFLREQMERKQI